VLRRDAVHLQVGTSPGVVINDRPGLYPFLRALDGSRDLPSLRRHVARDYPDLGADVVEVLAPLVSAGAVIDASAGTRAQLRVAVTRDGPSSAFAQTLGSLLIALDLDLAPEPDLTVMISTGEPPREPPASAVHMGLTHLIVRLDGDGARVGPLVIPGQTPCLGCLDLHRADWDPVWAALVPQFGRPLPHAVPTLIEHAAATEVAGECLDFARGELPRSATEIVAVQPDRTLRTITTARFHPRCTCSLLSVA
jgi:hypothetical protein